MSNIKKMLDRASKREAQRMERAWNEALKMRALKPDELEYLTYYSMQPAGRWWMKEVSPGLKRRLINLGLIELHFGWFNLTDKALRIVRELRNIRRFKDDVKTIRAMLDRLNLKGE
jgi:hypothetical protein